LRRRLPAEQQTLRQVYDRIELPPIKPDVTRMRLCQYPHQSMQLHIIIGIWFTDLISIKMTSEFGY